MSLFDTTLIEPWSGLKKYLLYLWTISLFCCPLCQSIYFRCRR